MTIVARLAQLLGLFAVCLLVAVFGFALAFGVALLVVMA